MAGYISESKTVEHPTPREIINQLELEFGRFQLDPCATHENAKAPRYFTKEEDGLIQPWEAERIYMNPPYGAGMGAWVRKAYEASQLGATVVCLLPARTDTKWFHEIALKGEIRFIKGRIAFEGSDGVGAPFPSMLLIFRPRQLEAVQSVFGSHVFS